MINCAPSNNNREEGYFYHSDHLGSASWITDNGGEPVLHLQYLPYGEPFVNQRTTGYNERFTFTGKELDTETGYSYFGARYLDHELLTSWMSVDPMADKYPNISPYAYCAWNPMKLVDPNGDTLRVINKKGDFLFSLDDNSTRINKITAKELYDNGIQWFEPNADNYMPLLTINSEINYIEGIVHFTWNEIEKFALTDRLMIEYRQGGSGDFKSKYAKHFLCTVDGIPYWTDVIGQIPFAINCYKTQLMNGRSHSEAAKITQFLGHVFAREFPFFDKHPNDADNWMIKRVCNWAIQHIYIQHNKPTCFSLYSCHEYKTYHTPRCAVDAGTCGAGPVHC